MRANNKDIPNGNKKIKKKVEGWREKELLYKWEDLPVGLPQHGPHLQWRSHRHKWDEETIQPYVTYTDESGTEHWHDSFLFLEIHDGLEDVRQRVHQSACKSA